MLKTLWRLNYSSPAVACYNINKVLLGQKLILIPSNLLQDRVLHDPKRLTGMVANLKSNLHIIQSLVLSYCVVIFHMTFSSPFPLSSLRSSLMFVRTYVHSRSFVIILFGARGLGDVIRSLETRSRYVNRQPLHTNCVEVDNTWSLP